MLSKRVTKRDNAQGRVSNSVVATLADSGIQIGSFSPSFTAGRILETANRAPGRLKVLDAPLGVNSFNHSSARFL